MTEVLAVVAFGVIGLASLALFTDFKGCLGRYTTNVVESYSTSRWWVSHSTQALYTDAARVRRLTRLVAGFCLLMFGVLVASQIAIVATRAIR